MEKSWLDILSQLEGPAIIALMLVIGGLFWLLRNLMNEWAKDTVVLTKLSTLQAIMVTDQAQVKETLAKLTTMIEMMVNRRD